MKVPYTKFIKALLAVIILSTTFSECANSSPNGSSSDSVVITDIASWKHPVKKIFSQNNIKLSKVVLTNHKKYPVFYVSFPYDPQSSQTSDYFNQLYAEVLAANGWWSYALQDEQDKVRIEVNWNKSKNEMTTNFVPLQ